MWDAIFGRGFNATKCKTLLRLAMARIKLLRNKRDIQVKQLRKDIAQLLTTGQEPSARIRVEHIIREENILAAYDILELFCELVAVRLPIIESQKNCPLDLKEAISSLIFASPRCSDLPELLQIRTLFAAKYGNEFTAAAAELRPDCGVNRRIIEKLSARAPPGDVKLKLMKEIAVEHNVDWDATDSEAELLKVHEDLLEGPTHFIGAHEMPPPPSGKSELLSVPSDPPTKVSPAPSTSETHSELTAPHPGVYTPDFVNEDKTKQFVPFGNIAPVRYEAPSSTVPLSQELQNDDMNSRNMPHLGGKYDTGSDATSDAKENAYAQARKDVAAAAKAAAESADRAVAAARAAAEVARKHDDHVARESDQTGRPDPSVAARDDSSDSDLDSDDEDGGNVPVRTEAPHGRPGRETDVAPAFDSESDVEEYDAPRGRGAGGTKVTSQADPYKQIEARGAHEEPKFPSKATKLDFESADGPGNSSFDDFHDNFNEVDELSSARRRKQEREDWSYGGDSTSGKKGGGLIWHSKAEPEKQDNFGTDPEHSAFPYGASGSTDYYFGKTISDEEDDSRLGKTYPSFDPPYAGESARPKLGPRSREGSPLFDEEGSVGRSREPSRLGSIPRTYDQYDASPVSSPPKSGVDDTPSTVEIGDGSWARRASSDAPLPLFGREISPEKDEYNDLAAQFDALKTTR